jgi:adenylate cyclase
MQIAPYPCLLTRSRALPALIRLLGIVLKQLIKHKFSCFSFSIKSTLLIGYWTRDLTSSWQRKSKIITIQSISLNTWAELTWAGHEGEGANAVLSLCQNWLRDQGFPEKLYCRIYGNSICKSPSELVSECVRCCLRVINLKVRGSSKCHKNRVQLSFWLCNFPKK